ncbi:unnamed protein product [Anisakis simplex]|uniref:Uncharacterized protein n=1 Tax=Anisakis simplex TaxID=6269 RepID=A0A3P6P2A4_ANISI|nr:unnamed protein product [Anisakis simplex]
MTNYRPMMCLALTFRSAKAMESSIVQSSVVWAPSSAGA